jgi:ketosteroid isomerase-like protein
MPENAYESLIRRTYQDFETGDLDLLGVVMAQEVVWHEPGRSSLAGHYKGPEEVLGFLRELKARTSGTFKIEVLDVLSEPERAVVFQRETAMKNEKSLDVIAAVDFEIHSGKITEVTVYQNDAYAFDEFWADDSGQEDNMDDVESELECSTREAGISRGSFGAG